MESWLAESTRYVGFVIEAMAVLIIAYASVEAFIRVVGVLLRATTDGEKRAIYLRYLRWLVAGLTFQLGADIVHTAIAPSWDELGRVAALAVIRTFLAYFLERDVREAKAEA